MGIIGCVGNRRQFLRTAALSALSVRSYGQSRPPNVVLIYADDLGYGDIGSYGSRIDTPNLDQMAAEGVRLTDFYSASPVCSPSRASLLTGRYPLRVGVPRVLNPDDTGGLPASETTIAGMLKAAGYRTSCIGKWHLGCRRGYLPKDRGFDEYFGIPYSNDMWPRVLLSNEDVVEETARLDNLTQRYTDRAVSFINRSKDGPFFLYFPHTFPHIPLAASQRFLGKSFQGAYGDAVMELDWSVGQVLQALKDAGVDHNTLVIFSSDNGPWFQGNAGRMRGRKGQTWEGGMRVPFLARFPGRIPTGLVSNGLATTMDVLPTIAGLTGAPLPANPLDGTDIWPLLTGQQASLERDVFLYFNDYDLQCARLGDWKLHLARFNVPLYTPTPGRGRTNLPLPRSELYDMVHDPEESYDRADRNQAVVADIRNRVDRLIRTFPNEVIDLYNRTMAKQVEDTPSGSLPIERGS
jgi:arylsulfatase A-like enzyme